MWVFVAGTVVLTLGLAFLTTQTALLLRHGPLPFNPLLSWGENSARLVLVGVCLLLVLAGERWAGLVPSDFGFVALEPLRDLGYGLGLGVVLPLMVNLVSLGLFRGRNSPFFSRNAILSMRPDTPNELLIVALAIFPAALLEELLFRSLLIGGMMAALGLPASLTIAVSALTFGMMHLAQGVWGVVMTALVGLLFGWLFVATGSLWLPLVAHWVMNILQFTLVYLRPDLIPGDE
jgi:membrane protease YdiL (CAAX protease family)